MLRHGHRRLAQGLLAAVPPALCLGVFVFFFAPIRRYLGVASPAFGSVAWDFLRGLPGLLHGRWSVLDIPLPDGFKHGPGESYVTIPFVALFGHTPAAMLWRDGVFGGLAVWTTYLLGLALYRDRWAAFLAGLILATSPTFVLYSMIGGRAGIAEAALGPAALYFMLRYADERKPWLACLGFASLGLALACRSTMAAFVLGLIAYACLYRRAAAALLPAQAARRRRLLLGCALSFLAFMSGYAWACVSHFGEFLSYWSQRLVVRDEIGSNLDYGGNLLQRLRQLAELAEGKDGLWFFVERAKAYPSSSLGFPAAALSIAAILLISQRRRIPRRWTVPWVVAIVYLLVSPFTPSMARVMHLFPLLPLACLAVSSVVAASSLRFRGVSADSAARLRAAIIASFLIFAAARVRAEALFFREFYAELARAGVYTPNLSSATLDAASWFSRRPEAVPVVFGGPGETLSYVSGGELPVVVFGESSGNPSAAIPAEWERVLRIKGARFVIIADPTGAFEEKPYFEALKLEASRRGLGLGLVETIRRPDGDPIFEIYRAAPSARKSLARAG